MEEYLMTARSVTQAQRMMQALSQHGIRAALVSWARRCV